MDELPDALICGARILRGSNAGFRCGRRATAIVVRDGLLVCGVHARAWLPKGLARIARWNKKERGWL